MTQNTQLQTGTDPRTGTDPLALRIGQVVGTCDHDKEPSGTIKCGEYLD
jgi:hypothetical protein